LAPQLPLSFPHPFHPVNQSLTITMANKSVYLSHPCPRCGNGNYPSMRSLTIHLNTCSNRFGLLPNAKEQPSTLPTLGQRAKQILQSMKRPHISGTLPNVNHLTFLPSNALAGPASTSDDQDTLFQSDNDVTDYDVFNDHNNNDTDNPTTTASTNVYNFQRGINPPPGVKFGIHLQHIISSHRSVDLKLYDEIIDLIHYHATTQETNFSTNKLYHQKELTTTLSQLYHLNGLQPTLHYVTLADLSLVTIPVFDVKAVILSILHDPQRMNPSNFSPGYDIFTGTLTDANNLKLNEIHTGSAWNTARDFYCGDSDAFPLALLCFYDKTHTDLYGSFS
jgi:hypothetical protein